MNLIDYNQAVEAIENERKLLLNRGQYGAENVLVHHALNVIAGLPIVRQPEIIRCKDCEHSKSYSNGEMFGCEFGNGLHEPDWYCADGVREER